MCRQRGTRWLVLSVLTALAATLATGCSKPPPPETMRKPPGPEAAAPGRTWQPAPGPGETFPSAGANHVPMGTAIAYRTDPPTSGPHYDQWVRAGKVYTEPPAPGLLVHSLEHGYVVIYFDPDQLAESDRQQLERLVTRYPGAWDGVLAVPRSDPEHPVIPTAWQKMLRLKEWDQAQVEAFVDAYRGRGPENPVR